MRRCKIIHKKYKNKITFIGACFIMSRSQCPIPIVTTICDINDVSAVCSIPVFTRFISLILTTHTIILAATNAVTHFVRSTKSRNALHKSLAATQCSVQCKTLSQFIHNCQLRTTKLYVLRNTRTTNQLL